MKIPKEGYLTGSSWNRMVFIGLQPLYPNRSQSIINHSPDGFNWGYGGSGPSQLALAILLELTNEPLAKKLYQKFKFEIIALLDEDFEYPITSIKKWIRAMSNNPIPFYKDKE